MEIHIKKDRDNNRICKENKKDTKESRNIIEEGPEKIKQQSNKEQKKVEV